MVSTASLYGGSHCVDNPREHQKVDVAGTGPQQRPGAGIGGGAGGEHVIDQNDAAAGKLGLALGGHAKGTLNILRAFGLGQPDLESQQGRDRWWSGWGRGWSEGGKEVRGGGR